MRQLCAAFGLVVLLLPSSVFAQGPTIVFQARVTSANGADAGVFSAGDAVDIQYTLNTDVTDVSGDPQAGVFPGASLNLSVGFPSLGVSALGSSGNVQTFDNFESGGVTSDQLFVFGGALQQSSLLGGNPITSVEIDFLSGFLPLPDLPTMLTSDALPLIVPPYSDGFVIFETSSGPTYVHFEVAGPTVHMTANGSPGPITLGAGDPLQIDIRFDAPGTGLTAAHVAIGVSSPIGVFWLGPAGFTSTPTPLFSGPLLDFGPVTLFNIASTAAYPSGSYKWFMVVYDAVTGASDVEFVETIIP
jgi:hypothetical protein